MKASGAMRRENAKLHPPSLRAQRSIPCFLLRRCGLLRFARNDGERAGVPDTPACVGYDYPLATRKILKAGSAIEGLPASVTPM
jgi:hypothetical protein